MTSTPQMNPPSCAQPPTTDAAHSRSGGSGPAWLAASSGWIGLLARLILGGSLLIAGALKVGRPITSARAVQAYELFPYDVAAAVGYALPVVEIAVGSLLVLGLFTRVSAVLGTVIMVAFIIGIASAWARGLAIDCGCFGGGGAIEAAATQYPLEIARDIGFVLCGLWLIWRPDTAWSLDARLGAARA